jgi:hypothetical protein
MSQMDGPLMIAEREPHADTAGASARNEETPVEPWFRRGDPVGCLKNSRLPEPARSLGSQDGAVSPDEQRPIL